MKKINMEVLDLVNATKNNRNLELAKQMGYMPMERAKDELLKLQTRIWQPAFDMDNDDIEKGLEIHRIQREMLALSLFDHEVMPIDIMDLNLRIDAINDAISLQKEGRI